MKPVSINIMLFGLQRIEKLLEVKLKALTFMKSPGTKAQA